MRDESRPELSPEQKERLLAKIKSSKAYARAYQDVEFMGKKDLRPIRLQLELQKPEMVLREHKIRSTIVVFGSARILSPFEARLQLDIARKQAAAQPGSDALRRRVRQAQMRLEQSRYYEEARRFAALISRAQQNDKSLEFVMVTGGGPGIMEAANRGAWELGRKSIGLNITLPREQNPNPYMTPELSFQFHYFALRKMHFLMRAKALAVFPGGYGTFDELFETLTLVQTGKKRPLPIVLFGKEFWERVVDWQFLAQNGMISWADARLFKIVEHAEEGWEHIKRFWKRQREARRAKPGLSADPAEIAEEAEAARE
ncbi:MAG: LOG family protein [Elusimicrobia bacterium]|nr:LOG family protein [Elusimicrobiota bacterium]MDE2238087.1 LOG family protein [Elusimicrobiota bacterium]MDE2424498.1 LOG family protein [Elusimicrobiota bacterium]